MADIDLSHTTPVAEGFDTAFYIDDVVINKRHVGNIHINKLGLIRATEDDDGSDSELDECEPGKVYVEWLDLDEHDYLDEDIDNHVRYGDADKMNVNDLQLVDRSYTIGSTVQYCDQPLGQGQVGVVIDGYALCDIMLCDGRVLKGVSNRDLSFITADIDDQVVKGDWLGVMEGIETTTAVRLASGTLVGLGEEADFEVGPDNPLYDLPSSLDMGIHGVPGLKGSMRRSELEAIPGHNLPRSGRRGKLSGVIEDSLATGDVRWVCSNPLKDTPGPMPDSTVSYVPCQEDEDDENGTARPSHGFKNDYQIFARHQHLNMQISDIVWYNPPRPEGGPRDSAAEAGPAHPDSDSEEEGPGDGVGAGVAGDVNCELAPAGSSHDHVQGKGKGKGKHAARKRREREKRKRERKKENKKKKQHERKGAYILSTTSYSTVLWQDGTIVKDMPNNRLWERKHNDEKEFLPYDLVIEPCEDAGRALPDFDDTDVTSPSYLTHLPNGSRIGMVVKAHASDRTIHVRWMEDIVKYFEGQEEGIVVTQDKDGKAIQVLDRPEVLQGANELPCEELAVYDVEDIPDVYTFGGWVGDYVVARRGRVPAGHPWLGIVLSTGHGRVKVEWLNGSISDSWFGDVINLHRMSQPTVLLF
eukprot:TRINITY_DN1785_c0_g1_i11.p1 TRINITY_DN1785_c0_g1~~TRINITY_DN1785_c0_g1_i11.p1  ORF type:complete len:641 (+),score=123.63 TRINITY_DN1785_c0_g1_i11:89-2011(+)